MTVASLLRWAGVPLVAVLLCGPAPARADLLSPHDQAVYHLAFEAAHQERFDLARAEARKGTSPLLGKVLAWMEYVSPQSGATFADITAFIRANPGWPDIPVLMRRAEEAITVATPDQAVLDWFDHDPPVTVAGAMAYGKALLASGQKAKATPLLRRLWIQGNFGAQQESTFLNDFGALLTAHDQIARLDRLLWEHQDSAAQQQLNRVPVAVRLEGLARLALARESSGAEQALARVPAALRADPGLIFERMRYLRAHDEDDQAIALLKSPASRRVHPELWWTERAIMARKQLGLGHITLAYDLARDHGQTSGRGYADAEWLAGWIALRFLNDSQTALNHFAQIYDRVTTPRSRARAAYWAGRSCEALKRRQDAARWYAAAAQNVTTFYGQLAAGRISRDQLWPMPADPLPTAQDISFFEKQDLVRISRMLGEIGESELIRPFMLHMNDLAKTPGERALAANLATSLGRADIAVAVAKRSEHEGVPLIASGYPIPAFREEGGPEKALVLGLIRQESAFHYEAVSSVGARGLMQLMPTTASRVAHGLGLRYRHLDTLTAALTANPDLNVRLGSAYLGSLLSTFNGSYILSIAAYNAGPTRVKRWVREMGDPRTADIDPVDWIESIPYSETRNYVQRVLEGTEIYRRRLGATGLALSLAGDMKR